MRKIIVLIVLYLIIVTITADKKFFKQSYKKESASESISLCVQSLALRYFNVGDIITITSPTINTIDKRTSSIVQTKVLKTLSRHLKWVFLNREAKNVTSANNFMEKSHNYIISLKEISSLEPTLNYLQGFAWNPHARFIVFCNEVLTADNMTTVVKNLWDKKAINFIVMSPKVFNSPDLYVHTWFPYRAKDCGTKFNNSVLINHCSNGVFDNLHKVFFNKVPNNLHGCPVKALTVVWPPYVVEPDNYNISKKTVGLNFTKGLEIQLMNTIAAKSNITVIYSVPEEPENWGTIQATGNATGALLDLLTEKVDIYFSCLAATANRFLFYDPTVSYTSESINICVPRAQVRQKWLSVFIILKFETWMSIIATYIILSFVVWCFTYKTNEYADYLSLINCLILMFCVLTATTVNRKPKTDHIRFLFMLWVIFCLHLLAIYQTVLIYFLVSPSYENQISTTEEIIEQNLRFSCMQHDFFYFKTNNDTLQFYDNKYICPEAKKCLENVAFARNESMAITKLFFLNKESYYRTTQGEPLLYLFNKDYMSYPIHMFAFKGFPMLIRINDLITQITQTGILNKWVTELRHTFNKNNVLKGDNQNDSPEILTLTQLEGAFLILGIGIVLSIIIFISELIIYHKHKQNNIRKNF